MCHLAAAVAGKTFTLLDIRHRFGRSFLLYRLNHPEDRASAHAVAATAAALAKWEA